MERELNLSKDFKELRSAMDERMQGEYVNVYKDSEIVKTINAFRGNRPTFGIGSSGSGSNSSPSNSTIVSPENLFDGQDNTASSISLSSSGSWNVMVFDFSPSWMQGTLNVTGEYYIGTIATSSLSQGNYTMQDGDFNMLLKSGYYFSSTASIVRNNVIVRSADLTINGTVLMRVFSDGGIYYFTVGLSMNRMRNILITTQPEKIFLAVRNGVFELVKTPKVLSISVPPNETSIIDIDALDINKRVGLKWTQQNNNYEMITISKIGNVGYGMIGSGDINFSNQVAILSNQTDLYGYIFNGDSYLGNVYASKNGDGSSPVLSSFISDPQNRRRYMWAIYDTQNFNRYILILGYGNDFQNYGVSYLTPNLFPQFTVFSAAAYASANSFYSFSVTNGNSSVNSLESTVGVWPKYYISENIRLLKNFGAQTSYYFPALKRPLLSSLNEQFMMFIHVNSLDTTVYFGLGTSTSEEPLVMSGTPSNIRLQISIDDNGTVLRDGVSFTAFPQTKISGFYTIYFSVSIPDSSETATINIGRNKFSVSSSHSIGVPYGTGVVPTFWTNGGTNDTQSLLCVVKGFNGNAYFIS